jgi:hypothetical protein
MLADAVNCKAHGEQGEELLSVINRRSGTAGRAWCGSRLSAWHPTK